MLAARRQKLVEDACTYFEQAIQYHQKHPELNARYMRSALRALTRAAVRRQDHARAFRAAVQLSRQFPEEALFAAHQMDACVALVEKDSTLSEANRKDRRAEYAAAARMLRQ
jgi:hypothetical protein